MRRRALITFGVALLLLSVASPCAAATVPTPSWGDQAQGPAQSIGGAVAVDDDGNVASAGWFWGPSARVYANTLTTPEFSSHMFLAKHDAAGNLLWIVSSSGEDANTSVIDVEFDGSGNVFVCGKVRGTATFGNVTFSSFFSSYPDAFVAKYDSNGMFQWIQFIEGIGAVEVVDLDVDAAGSVIAAGPLELNVIIAGQEFTEDSYPSRWLAKFDAQGIFEWVDVLGDRTVGSCIAIDTSGHIYAGDSDRVLRKYDPSGTLVWSRDFSSAFMWFSRFDVASNGDLIVAGNYRGTLDFDGQQISSAGSTNEIYLARLDPEGTVLWLTRGTQGTSGSVHDLDLDGDDSCYVTGTFVQEISFDGEKTIEGWFSGNQYLASFDSEGALRWADTMTENNKSEGYGIASTPEGAVIASGWFRTSVSLSGYLFSGPIEGHAFVLRYASTPTPVAPAPTWGLRLHTTPNPFNPRTTASFSIDVTGQVELDVLDSRGRLVRQLLRATVTAGIHEVQWDGLDDRGNKAASSTYLFRLRTPKGDTTARATLVK